MITGATAGWRARRLVGSLIFGLFVYSVTLTSPAFASPVPGDRYEGVYSNPVDRDTRLPDPEPTDQAIDRGAARFVGLLRTCRQPTPDPSIQVNPGISFQINRAATRADFAATFVLKDDRTGRRAYLTLLGTPGPGDDVNVTPRLEDRLRKGLVTEERFTISGNMTLADTGEQVPIETGSNVFLNAVFRRLFLDCGRNFINSAEGVVGNAVATVFTGGPKGTPGATEWDSDLVFLGGFACSNALCDRERGDAASAGAVASLKRTTKPSSADALELARGMRYLRRALSR